ncbi:MAG TPA: hypothetical protein VFZ34_24105 [Blastocatellia bacterium]|nr:hypothetical protein [Blastocatellia bacterium]
MVVGLLFGSYGIYSSSANAQQPIHSTTRNDAIARLQQQLERGATQLEFAETTGYLPSLLKLLDVPVSSQSLVFSKTSLQSNHISPSNPRAIYFNDNVFVGWIRGADLIEITALDPTLGAELYVLEQTKSDKPRFQRGIGCSGCHVAGNTRFVAGPLMRSVYTGSSGSGIGEARSFITDHTSPFNERWGGWYVTGTHGSIKHLGNMFFSGDSNLDDEDALTGGNVTSLRDKVDLKGYLSPHSDIVALMVMAHQTQGQNLIVWAGQETRLAVKEQEELNQAALSDVAKWETSPKFRVTYAVDELLKYFLFAAEAKFDAPIKGTTTFAEEFAARGIKDKQGRGLRDFDLQQRLFRYPLSYLIYTEAFDNLPTLARDLFYRRLWLALNGQDKTFAHLRPADRKAMLEILCDTKQNLPEYFYNAKRTTD